jgi:hypothetical protein
MVVVNGPNTELVVPVVVHYMQNRAFPTDDVKVKFPPYLLEKLFDPSGDFNRIWSMSKARIRFSLHGVQTCDYALTDFGYFEEHEEVPSPTSDRDLFPAFVRRYNFGLQGDDSGCRSEAPIPPARVLDLYLFWKLNTWAGWAQPPKGQRPGAVWIDTDSVPDHDSDRVFAHEVGHFFGLCHPCREDGPDVDTCRGRLLPLCSQEHAKRLMAPSYGGALLLDSETTAARRRAEQLFGP